MSCIPGPLLVFFHSVFGGKKGAKIMKKLIPASTESSSRQIPSHVTNVLLPWAAVDFFHSVFVQKKGGEKRRNLFQHALDRLGNRSHIL